MALDDISFTNNLGTITFKRAMMDISDDWQWNGRNPVHRKRVSLEARITRDAAEEVDGHDVAQLHATLKRTPFNPNKPSVILCHTVKGRGVSFVENNLNWHHKNKVSEEEIGALLAELEEKL